MTGPANRHTRRRTARGQSTDLARDTRGATIIEFAIIAPVMILLIVALGELLYDAYAKSILLGEIQKAARASGIEGGAATAADIDGRVVAKMAPVMKNLTQNCTPGSYAVPVWCSTRKNYDTFSQIAPEKFTDSNGNGIRDPGECFEDVNGNLQWDSDPGAAGQGGASAVTMYTITITYPPMFPVVTLLGWPSRITASGSTVLKNQPYASQTTTTSRTVCT